MARPIIRTLLLCAAGASLMCNAVALPSPGFKPDDQNSSTKKTTANPKKPAAKNSGESDKIKTDDRMSTRGLKPHPKEADKSTKSDAKSSSNSDSNTPK